MVRKEIICKKGKTVAVKWSEVRTPMAKMVRMVPMAKTELMVPTASDGQDGTDGKDGATQPTQRRS